MLDSADFQDLGRKGSGMSLLLGALTLGFIFSLVALGVFISFRIFAFPDITADGSSTLGAALAAMLLVKNVNPLLATAAGFGAGFLAGALTGTLATKCKIHGLLAGILVMTGLYSVNLHIMGRSNISVLGASTLSTYAERVGTLLARNRNLNVLGWEITALEASLLVASFLFILLAGCVMYVFFHTNLGTAMRATGDNGEMVRALGVNDGNMIILGLAVSNGLIALGGAFIAQYQGFADVQMGIGMVVWGLASVIIGEALVGTRQLGLSIIGAVMGSVLFRLLVAIALRLGLNPNDLKLVTAAFVFLALVAPRLLKRLNLLRPRSSHA
jgi:putative tryptophan/tyrosine transport system permease protein